ncbi:MAG: D-tyrosyl-tRNA(Tyr) deacylase [Erysipelotrichaceae bacterium]|nr:D-tyrosyl-tRNA(Tyr) deacylase [Erysipelotrichaceae bacterium]
MRVVLQRVAHANVKVEKEIVGEIQQGFLLLVGITHEDNKEDVEKMAKKCVELRIFEDEEGKMNKSIFDVGGEILSISQFTLYADCQKGRRPSFVKAAPRELAQDLYHLFNEALKSYQIPVQTGKFGADMKVSLLNDGPITILLDSDEL